MTRIPSNETYEPSAPNRFRFGVKLLLAVIVGTIGIHMFDNEREFPLPQVFVALALLIGPRNLQALLSPPYLRLSHQGLKMRVWLHPSMNWSALFAKLFFPFRRYTTVEIPWDQLTAIKPFKSTVNGITMEHSMTIGYQTSDGTAQTIKFSRGLFSMTPLDLGIAIQEYQDREFRWKPLRESGVLNVWVSRQQLNFQRPVTIRYRPNRHLLGVGVAGLLVLGATIVSVNLSHSVWEGSTNWIFGIATLAVFVGLCEIGNWLTIGKRRTVVLSADGLSLGRLDSPSIQYLWSDIVSARLRQVNRSLSGGTGILCTDGLDVSFADGCRLSLPDSYDYSLKELERLLTPDIRHRRQWKPSNRSDDVGLCLP